MTSIRTTLAALLCLITFNSAAETALKLDGLLPPGSQYALFVQTLDDKEPSNLVTHNSDLLLPPASTQKIITALAAKLILAPDFRFTTTLEKSGDDLVLRFSGDPTLTRFNLKQLFTHYKKRYGKNQINNIWLDNTAFVGHERAVGWPWEGLGACYSAPSSVVNLDKNCVHTAVYSNKAPGNLTRVNVPKHHPIKVFTSADIVTIEQQKQRMCNLELTFSPNNEYQLTGCLGKRKEPLPLKLAVQNPALFTQEVIKKQLKTLGIQYKGKVEIGVPKTDAKSEVLLSHRSAPLTQLLDKMLKQSDNLIADTIFKTLGSRHFNHPGSYLSGAVALRAIIKEKAGIDLSSAIIEDGSGLSRNNRISVRQLVDIIRYIAKNERELKLLALLPVSGKNGTMKYRRSVSKPPLKGRFKAKTGSLFGTKNLAGILRTAKGKRLIVAQIVTNYFPKKGKKRNGSITAFEKKLYQGLYKSY